MTNGVPQANGTMMVEPRMDVAHVADAVVHMASLPLDANVLFMTMMATKMPFVGRGTPPFRPGPPPATREGRAPPVVVVLRRRAKAPSPARGMLEKPPAQGGRRQEAPPPRPKKRAPGARAWAAVGLRHRQRRRCRGRRRDLGHRRGRQHRRQGHRQGDRKDHRRRHAGQQRVVSDACGSRAQSDTHGIDSMTNIHLIGGEKGGVKQV